MFTGGGRKKAQNGQHGSSSQRSRSRMHEVNQFRIDQFDCYPNFVYHSAKRLLHFLLPFSQDQKINRTIPTCIGAMEVVPLVHRQHHSPWVLCTPTVLVASINRPHRVDVQSTHPIVQICRHIIKQAYRI